MSALAFPSVMTRTTGDFAENAGLCRLFFFVERSTNSFA